LPFVVCEHLEFNISIALTKEKLFMDPVTGKVRFRKGFWPFLWWSKSKKRDQFEGSLGVVLGVLASEHIVYKRPFRITIGEQHFHPRQIGLVFSENPKYPIGVLIAEQKDIWFGRILRRNIFTLLRPQSPCPYSNRMWIGHSVWVGGDSEQDVIKRLQDLKVEGKRLWIQYYFVGKMAKYWPYNEKYCK